MFKNPFAQFLKLETDFVKYWKLTEKSTLVGHLNAGVVRSYGNTEKAPYYEQFYVGGANSIRAFNVRSIGPGKFAPTNSKFSYIDRTGDIKFVANRNIDQEFGVICMVQYLRIWVMSGISMKRSIAKMENFMPETFLNRWLWVRVLVSDMTWECL